MKDERILIVDDTPENLTLLRAALEPEGYEVLAVANGAQALKLVAHARPALILLDVMMPGLDGMTVCHELKRDESTSAIPVLFVSAREDSESIVRGFRAGAVDYVVKPFLPEEIVIRVATHLRISRLTSELQLRNLELETEMSRRREAERGRVSADARVSTLVARETQRWGLPGFIGESRLLRAIRSDIERLHSFGKTTVLITGESGTGKELVARAIHHSSPRASGAFIPVNCVAVPGELAESLFFGHVKGAFTGATSDKKGYFELADGGTLFLDEIGDMPAALQAKLLRVLEDGKVTPVGSNQSRQVDVRVLAATNADLQRSIARGEFRQDLFYRLARYTVETPALRQRREDIPLLAAHFLEHFASEMGMEPPCLSPAAAAVLSEYSFPGNVRELKNCIERALILSGGGPIDRGHLPVFVNAQTPSIHGSAPIAPDLAGADGPHALANLPLNLEAAENALIQRALTQTGGNVVEAARLLGVNRSRIYRRFPQGSIEAAAD